MARDTQIPSRGLPQFNKMVFMTPEDAKRRVLARAGCTDVVRMARWRAAIFWRPHWCDRSSCKCSQPLIRPCQKTDFSKVEGVHPSNEATRHGIAANRLLMLGIRRTRIQRKT